MIDISKSMRKDKGGLLSYLRSRAEESLEEVRRTYARTEFREQATAINRAIIETKDNLIKTLLQKATKEKWVKREVLECILMITYASYVVMIESRNEVWPYEYMTFSRRIGEIWDPFCRLCFDYPVKDIERGYPESS